MTRQSYKAIALALTAALAAGALAGAAAAETNLTGHWGRYPGRGVTADPKLVAPRAGEPDLKAPYAAQYKALRERQREFDAKGEPLANSGTECLPSGMPGMMGAIYPLEILQTPDQVTIIAEANSEVRRIYLNDKLPAVDEVPPGYFGYSVGKWEGDTLAVQTVGVKDTVRYRDIAHSDKMRVTENLRLVAPDVLHDVVTIEDPDVLAKPYTVTFAYGRLKDYKMLEYVCENNRTYIDDKGVARMRLDPESKK
ncbi:MAG: hypothetical protein ABIO39_03795 [Caulobacteraceae bacterium]